MTTGSHGENARAATDLEVRKLARSPVTRIATAAVLLVTVLTTVGGYAAATRSPTTDLGRKAAAMVTAPGWPGYTGLAATSVGVSLLLAAGIVMAWSVGREFTDGTIVGLFAIPPRPSTIAAAKIGAATAWVALLVLTVAVLLGLGGVALGLPGSGALAAGATIATCGALLGAAALPVMWVATRLRGYLAGIAATLALVVITNLAAGFGLGGLLPWAVPVLWATPGSHTSVAALGLPVIVAVLGGGAVLRAWDRLQLGTS